MLLPTIASKLALTLLAISTPDLNHTGTVDLSDFALFQIEFGKFGVKGGSPADFNFDRYVDLADYAIIFAQFADPVLCEPCIDKSECKFVSLYGLPLAAEWLPLTATCEANCCRYNCSNGAGCCVNDFDCGDYDPCLIGCAQGMQICMEDTYRCCESDNECSIPFGTDSCCYRGVCRNGECDVAYFNWCDDGLGCNGHERCGYTVDGLCTCLVDLNPCDDHEACTYDYCDPVTDECIHTPNACSHEYGDWECAGHPCDFDTGTCLCDQP